MDFIHQLIRSMKKAILILAVGLLMGFSQCSPRTSASRTTLTEAQRVEQALARYQPADMEEGRRLWQERCVDCHKLYAPESRTVKKWDQILPRMMKRSKLTEEQAGKVRAYIITKAPLATSS